MKKSILFFIIALISLALLTSCGEKAPTSPDTGSGPVVPPAPTFTDTITPGGPTLTYTETPTETIDIPSETPTIEFGTLGDALDNNLVVWYTGGSSNWFYQTTDSNDGIDAARSGAIANGQFSYLEADVIGPIVVSFYWSTDSALVSNVLAFFIDDVLQTGGVIAGFIPWEHVEYVVPAGVHTIKWVYEKAIAAGAEQDCAWLDQVVFIAITNTPTETQTEVDTLTITKTNTVPINTNTNTPTITVTVPINTMTNTATITLAYTSSATQTETEHISSTVTQTNTETITEIETDTHTNTPTVTLSFTITTPTTDTQTITHTPTITLTPTATLGEIAQGVDWWGATWWAIPLGNSWYMQTAITHDGTDAIQSPPAVDDNKWTLFVETAVSGPADISFWWKISSQPGDQLILTVNGSQIEWLEGEVDWTEVNFSVVSTNPNIIKIFYKKDLSGSAGSDCGWVDMFSVTYPPPNTPTSTLTHTPSTTPTVTVTITQTSSITPTSTATLTFTITPVGWDAYEPDDNTAAANDISVWETQYHSYHDSSDDDYTKLSCTAGKRYHVYTHGLESNSETYMKVFDGISATPVITSSWFIEPTSYVMWDVETAADYYIKVTNEDWSMPYGDNLFGADTGYYVSVSEVTVNSVSLANAVDIGGYTFYTEGDLTWTGQDGITNDGVDAAECGGVETGQTADFYTTVTGPGTVFFYWRNMSHDDIELIVGGVVELSSDGSASTNLSAWQYKGFHIDYIGPIEVRWRYIPGGLTGNYVADKVYIDQISYVPD